MNYIIPSKPAQLPLYQDRPPTLPVVAVADSAADSRGAGKQPRYAYIYRGELLEAVANDKRYRPQLNLQIDPDNRRAIDTYQSVASDPPLMGRLVDGFI